MKKILYILLFVPLFFISSCEEQGPIHGCLDSQAINYNSEATIDNNSCEYLEICFAYQGGIIFYIDETGEHGLVAAMEDLGQFQWGCYQEYVDGSDGTSIGTGYHNTMDIVNQGCATENGGFTAAQAALDAEINGYNDWYLPSKDELVEMYNTIGNGGPDGNIGGFTTSNTPYYWSSSEYDYNFACFVFFSDGLSLYANKFNTYRVRPIRSF